jgi:hypothetical protein
MTNAQDKAARLDSLIDALIRSGDRLAPVEGEPELAATARLLREALPTFHPRFRFEEMLASRLRRFRPGAAAAHERERPRIIRFPDRSAGGREAGATTPAEHHRRGLVAGGAIASGVSIAIPLAGAAFVMWRRGRSSGGIF